MPGRRRSAPSNASASKRSPRPPAWPSPTSARSAPSRRVPNASATTPARLALSRPEYPDAILDSPFLGVGNFYSAPPFGSAEREPVLRQMFFGFANNDEQAVVPLLRALASSTSFSQRSETP